MMIYKFLKHWLSISLCLYIFSTYFFLNDLSIPFLFSRIPIFFQSKFIWLFILSACLAMLNMIWLEALKKLNQHFMIVNIAMISLIGCWCYLFSYRYYPHSIAITLMGCLWFFNLWIPLIKYHYINKSLELYQQSLNDKR